MKKVNEKGFTLAELLIVVAIIAILVAIAIPTFGNYLEKAREATDASNLETAASTAVLEYTASEGNTADVVKEVKLKQTVDGWEGASYAKDLMTIFSGGGGYLQPPKGGTAIITCDHLTGLVGVQYKDSSDAPVTTYDSSVNGLTLTVAASTTDAPNTKFDKTSGVFSLDLTKYTTKLASDTTGDPASIEYTSGQTIAIKPGASKNIKSASVLHNADTYAINGVVDNVAASETKLTIVVMKSDGSAGELEVTLQATT